MKMKPDIGPRDFWLASESVVSQLQAGETVTVEMAVRTSDSARHGASVKVLNRLVKLVEGVGEAQVFDTGERVRPKVVLLPISPPPPAWVYRARLTTLVALTRELRQGMGGHDQARSGASARRWERPRTRGAPSRLRLSSACQ